MIKLTCDWCQAEIRLQFRRLNSGAIVVSHRDGKAGGTGLEHTKWYFNDITIGPLLGELCPDCKGAADAEQKKADDEVRKLRKSALAEVECQKKKLLEDAREAAKQQRAPRLERDTVMRKKERRRIADQALS